ncbi:hypothetical protein D9M68_742250 [compost metagenome]
MFDRQASETLADHDEKAEGQAKEHHQAGEEAGHLCRAARVLVADQAPAAVGALQHLRTDLNALHVDLPGRRGVEQQLLALVNLHAEATQLQSVPHFSQGAGQVEAGQQKPTRIVWQIQGQGQQATLSSVQVERHAHLRFCIER